MARLKTVIVEDEDKSLAVLKYLVERHLAEQVEIIHAFSDPLKAKAYLESNAVDLVFLDIQMPRMNGFELLDSLTNIEFDLIFTTAFNNYATKAFRYYAIDYLIKPVIAEELIEAVKRVESRNSFRYGKQDLAQIFKAIDDQRDEFTRLAVPTKEGVEFIQMNDILRLEADGNYTFIYLTNGNKLYTSKTLKIFENLLPSARFYRPHQSHIINAQCMRKYVKNDGGYILMSDGAQIAIARSKRKDFTDRFY